MKKLRPSALLVSGSPVSSDMLRVLSKTFDVITFTDITSKILVEGKVPVDLAVVAGMPTEREVLVAATVPESAPIVMVGLSESQAARLRNLPVLAGRRLLLVDPKDFESYLPSVLEFAQHEMSASVNKAAEDLPLSQDIEITFAPELTAEQVEGTLTALANYFRKCGGVGLSAEFEGQEQVVREDVHV
jgi:hypothetical protein